MKPNNQHQKILKLLIEFPIITTNFLLNIKFHKGCSRLGEIEDKHGIITERGWFKFTNELGVKSQCRSYRCTDVEKAKEPFRRYEPKKPTKK